MERQIAKELLSIGAVFLRPDEPFTWASGIKSPVYCDNRLTLSEPQVRDQIENALSKVVQEKYPDCEILMGTSTAGIPHAAIVANLLACQWAMCAAARRITAAQTGSKASSCPVRKRLWWRT